MTKNVNKNSNKNIINIKIGDTKKKRRKSKKKVKPIIISAGGSIPYAQQSQPQPQPQIQHLNYNKKSDDYFKEPLAARERNNSILNNVNTKTEYSNPLSEQNINSHNKETFDYNNLYDIYDSYKPDINDDNMSSVSSLTHYSKNTKENNNNEIFDDKSFAPASVKSNATLNIDPNEINYNYNPLNENNLKSEEKIIYSDFKEDNNNNNSLALTPFHKLNNTGISLQNDISLKPAEWWDNDKHSIYSEMHLREHKNDDNKMNIALLSDVNSPNSFLETIEKASEKPIVNKDEERKKYYENYQKNINDINTERRKISASIDAYNELITELGDTKEGNNKLTQEQKNKLGQALKFVNKRSGNTKTKKSALTYLQRYKDTFDQEMKKKQQELDDIENTKKQEHNKSMRPKKKNIHTVTSDNDGIVVSNKIHR